MPVKEKLCTPADHWTDKWTTPKSTGSECEIQVFKKLIVLEMKFALCAQRRLRLMLLLLLLSSGASPLQNTHRATTCSPQIGFKES